GQECQGQRGTTMIAQSSEPRIERGAAGADQVVVAAALKTQTIANADQVVAVILKLGTVALEEIWIVQCRIGSNNRASHGKVAVARSIGPQIIKAAAAAELSRVAADGAVGQDKRGAAGNAAAETSRIIAIERTGRYCQI